jgi:hypothetical protein
MFSSVTGLASHVQHGTPRRQPRPPLQSRCQNIATMLQYIEGEPRFTILDFGCGPGRDLKVVAELGHIAAGLEGAAHFADTARAYSGCEVWQQDFLKLDLPDNYFDGTSTAGSAAKAARARQLGFEDVIDLTGEGLTDGVRRITAGSGVDIVIESIGGAVTSEALSSPGLGGVLITLGYSAGRKTTIDVTDLIWKGAQMVGYSLFAQSPTAIATAWRDIIPLIVGGSVKPIVERVYPLGEAGGALRHLIEDRPFGKVILAG